MNWFGTWTLFKKEVQRFMNVILQTIFSPVITALLYLIIFLPFGEKLSEYGDASVSYGLFLIPGLVMMTVLQNAFSNSSSSMIQSKFFGNIIFLLVSPLSSFEIYIAFVAAAILRGILVGIAVFAGGALLYDISFAHPLLMLLFTISCSATMGAMGLIAGIWAEKFDHLSGFQNFVIVPMTFLSGVFYSIDKLPELWQQFSKFNPFFYMIDGLRFTVLGRSSENFEFSLFIVILFGMALSLICYVLLEKGYKLRS